MLQVISINIPLNNSLAANSSKDNSESGLVSSIVSNLIFLSSLTLSSRFLELSLIGIITGPFTSSAALRTQNITI